MNRIDRLSAILIQLQSQRIVKAQDIADRFGISLRTVYRDIRSLEGSGIPILGEAGVGYSIMEGYRLPPAMLTKEEASAFLTAEKFISTMTDNATREAYRSALFKIRSILRSEEQDYLEDLEENIEVFPTNAAPDNRPKRRFMPSILNAISAKEVLAIDYVAAYNGKKTEREVEPVGVFFSSENWHLIAWCRLRKAYRDFRIDRILKLTGCEEYFSQSHPTLQEYLGRIAHDRELHTSVVSFSRVSSPYAERQKYFNGFVQQKEVGDRVEMTFLTISLIGLSRWLLMFTNQVEIVSPPELLDLMKKQSQDLKTHYL
ncbi:MAG: YafY family protein [Calditrichota bacterium]